MNKTVTGLLLLICFHTNSQQSIFVVNSGGDLYSMDLNQCSKQFIGSTAIGLKDIAFTTNGVLWGIDGGQIYRIDTTTGNASLVGNTGINAVSLVGLDDQTLLAESDLKLYRINTVNGAATYFDTIGYKASGDLTWYDDDVYMVTSSDQIIRMVLNSKHTGILRVTPIGSSIPTCEAAATSSFVNDYNAIIGFNRQEDILKICQIDGSFQNICPNLKIGRIAGAASLRLSTQLPQPTSCSAAGTKNLKDPNQFSVYPNPASNEICIKVNSDQKSYFHIYSPSGQLIKAGIVVNHSVLIPLNDMSAGLYILEISTNSTKDKYRLVVEH